MTAGKKAILLPFQVGGFITSGANQDKVLRSARENRVGIKKREEILVFLSAHLFSPFLYSIVEERRSSLHDLYSMHTSSRRDSEP